MLFRGLPEPTLGRRQAKAICLVRLRLLDQVSFQALAGPSDCVSGREHPGHEVQRLGNPVGFHQGVEEPPHVDFVGQQRLYLFVEVGAPHVARGGHGGIRVKCLKHDKPPTRSS